MNGHTQKATRAKPLAPEERRRVILDAVIPLLIEHGTEVTSREIAAAAGIAEGTIYRAFPDKEALILAALKRQFEGASAGEAITDIPAGLGLRPTLERLVDTMRNRTIRMVSLMAAAGPARMREVQQQMLAGAERPQQDRRQPSQRQPSQRQVGPHPMAAQAITQIADLLTPYRDELRVPPREAATLTRLTVLAMSHPMMTGGESYTSGEIVDYLAHGIGKPRADFPPATPQPATPGAPTHAV